MEGSLEQPPLILTSSRKLLGLAMLGAVAFAPLSFWLLTRPDASPKATIAGVVGIIFSAAASMIGGIKMVRPDRLELSPGGLRFVSLTQHTFDLPWADVGGFRLWQMRGGAGVVFDLSERAKQSVRTSPLNKSLTGADIGLPGAWPVDSEKMLGLLTEAKARWA